MAIELTVVWGPSLNLKHFLCQSLVVVLGPKLLIGLSAQGCQRQLKLTQLCIVLSSKAPPAFHTKGNERGVRHEMNAAMQRSREARTSPV